MSKYLTSFLLFLFSFPFLYAQMRTAEEPERPSADVWRQINYGTVTPSLYTGTVNISIPIYTYSDPDFNIPIQLDYASNGCKPNERAGIVGHEWTIQYGGSITREIRGIPDDYIEKTDVYGYLQTHQLPAITNPHYFHLSQYQIGPTTLNNSGAGVHHSGIVFSNNNSTTIPYYDAEPDVFYFDIPGHHGCFHLGPNDSIYVYNTGRDPSEYKVEIEYTSTAIAIQNTSPYFNLETLRTNSRISRFTIKTSDGYSYVFNGYSAATGFGPGNDASNLDMVKGTQFPGQAGSVPYDIISWHLSKIIAPNGRQVEYSYSRNDLVAGIRPSCYRIAETSNSLATTNLQNYAVEYTYSLSYYAIPSSIAIDGNTTIQFSYNQTHTESVNNSAVPCMLLDKISVRNNDNIIKTAGISYTTTGPYVQNILLSGEGQYTMEYASTSYPEIGTKSVDHWGYYNGRMSGDFLTVSQVDTSTYQETISPGNFREPLFSHAQIGLLTRLDYPTGGYSTFSYEPQTYSKAYKKNGSVITIQQENGTCGGARISGLSHYDRNGEVITSRTYHYIKEDGTTPSGILSYFPRYKITYSAIISFTFPYEPIPYGNLIDTSVVYGVLQSNNLTQYEMKPIEYPRVEDRVSDGSKIVYTFSSSEETERRNQCATSSVNVPDYYILLQGPDMMAAQEIVRPYISTQAIRGKVMKKEIYDKGNQPQVQEVETSLYNPGFRYSWVMNRLIHSCQTTGIFIGRDTLRSNTHFRYVGGLPSVSTTTTYTYNATGQTASESVTGSDGTVRRTEYLYVTDSCRTGTVDAAMLAANCIGTPWRERVYEGNTLVSETVRVFYQPDSQNHPTLFCLESSSVRDGRTDVVYTTTFQHDALGRTVQVTGPDGRSSVHLWGHGGLYPVARIDGATLSQVRTAIGDATLGMAPLSGGMDATTAGLLRSSLAAPAEVTVYAWDPLVGLTATTGPDGRTTTYEYNLTGKLKGIRDDGGHLVEEYRYSPDNKLN